jgi:adenylate cyclase
MLMGKRMLQYLVVVVLATTIGAGIARTSWHRALEDAYYDWWHVLAGARYTPSYTALVTIDDETLLALKDDPLAFWAPYFGRALQVLEQTGAKAVGFDVLYQVSAEGWLRKLNLPDSEVSRNYDAPLRAAFAQGNVVLITHLVTRKDGAELLTPPMDQLVLLPGGIHDLGIANLFPDEDKYVRHFLPVLDPDPQKPGVSLAMQLALRAAGKDPAQAEWEIAGAIWSRDTAAQFIGFTGPPGTIPVVSMATLLRPDALQDASVRSLRDKVVILAANNTGTTDQHVTPYSHGAHAEQMAGGEIHANIVETILSGRVPRPMPLPLEIGYLVALLAIATWFFLRLPVSRGAVLVVIACVAIALPGYVMLHYDWIIPVAEPQTGILATFLMTLGLRLTREERERVRIRKIFGKYVSDEVVDKLLSDERRPDLAGEVLTVTVLFSDIRNFTTISEKLGAHEVVEMLNAYFSRACEPILAEGGTVDKYIGDAVMAVFGSPVPRPDHARRALRAALGIARAADEFRGWMRERFPDRGLPEFGVGIGLHSGEAVIGDIGTPKRKEFTAIGDTVNAASRLESITKELKCVLMASEATVRAAGEGVRTGKSEEVTLKGKTEPLRVYEVVGLDEV